MNAATLVQKLWNSACLLSVDADKYCNILRDDLSAGGHAQAGGLSYDGAAPRKRGPQKRPKGAGGN